MERTLVVHRNQWENELKFLPITIQNEVYNYADKVLNAIAKYNVISIKDSINEK